MRYSLYREKGRDQEGKGHAPGLPASGAGPDYSCVAPTWAPHPCCCDSTWVLAYMPREAHDASITVLHWFKSLPAEKVGPCCAGAGASQGELWLPPHAQRVTKWTRLMNWRPCSSNKKRPRPEQKNNLEVGSNSTCFTYFLQDPG